MKELANRHLLVQNKLSGALLKCTCNRLLIGNKTLRELLCIAVDGRVDMYTVECRRGRIERDWEWL